jgi:hypothetical protein
MVYYKSVFERKKISFCRFYGISSKKIFYASKHEIKSYQHPFLLKDEPQKKYLYNKKLLFNNVSIFRSPIS